VRKAKGLSHRSGADVNRHGVVPLRHFAAQAHKEAMASLAAMEKASSRVLESLARVASRGQENRGLPAWIGVWRAPPARFQSSKRFNS
jgi:hypothetical protein